MFQIALISSPENFPGEHEILEEMFELGLQRLYARKPQMPAHQLEQWIMKFDRKRQSNVLPWPGSAHSFEELKKNEEAEICFLSPIFDSISKTGYKAGFSKQELREGIAAWKIFQKKENRSQKLFALGGIKTGNLAEIAELGFNGAAVLGAVWRSPNPVNTWKEVSSYRASQGAISVL